MPTTYNKPITFTAPQATIKIGNTICGYVQNITFTENISRGSVQGLGSLTMKEIPALSVGCTFNIGYFFIDFKSDGMGEMLNRYGSIQNVINTMVFGEEGFSIMVFKKTIVSSEGGLVTEVDNEGETILNIAPCFLNSTNLTINDGQISQSNVSGTYLNPIALSR